jgi:hypothetical protein
MVLALVTGCGSSKSNPGDGGGGIGGGQTGCANLATKVCERFATCAPALLPLFGFSDMASCVSFEQGSCETTLSSPHSGDAQALAAQCGDALGAMSCDQFLGGDNAASCIPHGGTSAIGGSCSNSWQCASGSCALSDPSVCGACAAQVPPGQPCNFGQCAPNLACSASAPGSTTTVCAAFVGIGATCNDSAVCPVNAYCDATTSKCTKLPAPGETCDPATVTFCDLAGPPAFCDATTSKCAATTIVSPGDPCDPSNIFAVACKGTCVLDADAGTGTCTATVPLGGTCATGDVCAAGYPCMNGICATPVCDGTLIAAGTTAAVTTGIVARRRFHLPF